MTQYPYSAYGSNPNAGINVNDDHGWGGYAWPNGVPSNLLSTWKQANAGGNSTLTFRKELQELVTLSCQFGPLNGYPINAYVNGEYWGPWSYENRAISGTSTPSNHSKGKAWDINAPNNPYTSPLVCDMPPAFVANMESVGWCWGGRYSGNKDAMHYEYGYSPADVAGHVAKAKSILGNTQPPAGDWFDMATEQDLIDAIKSVVPGIVQQQLINALPRALDALLTGQPNSYIPNGSSPDVLDGMGVKGFLRRLPQAMRFGQENAAYQKANTMGIDNKGIDGVVKENA